MFLLHVKELTFCNSDGQVYMSIRSMMTRGIEIPGIDFKKLRLRMGGTYYLPGSIFNLPVYNVKYNGVETKVQVVTKPIHYKLFLVHQQKWQAQKRAGNYRHDDGTLCSVTN